MKTDEKKKDEKKKEAPPRRALRINTFCEVYGVSRSSAYRLIADGTLETVKVGNMRLVPVDSAEGLLKKGDTPAKGARHD